MEYFVQINWLATLVSAVIAYMVGGIWFHPKVFGGSWLRALDKQQDELGNPGFAMGIGALTTIVTAVAISWLVNATGTDTPGDAIILALVSGTGIYLVTAASDYLYCNWPNKVQVTQGSYRLVSFVIMAVTVTIW